MFEIFFLIIFLALKILLDHQTFSAQAIMARFPWLRRLLTGNSKESFNRDITADDFLDKIVMAFALTTAYQHFSKQQSAPSIIEFAMTDLRLQQEHHSLCVSRCCDIYPLSDISHVPNPSQALAIPFKIASIEQRLRYRRDRNTASVQNGCLDSSCSTNTSRKSKKHRQDKRSKAIPLWPDAPEDVQYLRPYKASDAEKFLYLESKACYFLQRFLSAPQPIWRRFFQVHEHEDLPPAQYCKARAACFVGNLDIFFDYAWVTVDKQAGKDQKNPKVKRRKKVAGPKSVPASPREGDKNYQNPNDSAGAGCRPKPNRRRKRRRFTADTDPVVLIYNKWAPSLPMDLPYMVGELRKDRECVAKLRQEAILIEDRLKNDIAINKKWATDKERLRKMTPRLVEWLELEDAASSGATHTDGVQSESGRMLYAGEVISADATTPANIEDSWKSFLDRVEEARVLAAMGADGIKKF